MVELGKNATVSVGVVLDGWPVAMRRHLPVRGPFRAIAQRARGVVQHGRVMIAARPEPVFQNEAGDAVLIEPERIIIALVRREKLVAAAARGADIAAADHHRGHAAAHDVGAGVGGADAGARPLLAALSSAPLNAWGQSPSNPV